MKLGARFRIPSTRLSNLRNRISLLQRVIRGDDTPQARSVCFIMQHFSQAVMHLNLLDDLQLVVTIS